MPIFTLNKNIQIFYLSGARVKKKLGYNNVELWNEIQIGDLMQQLDK